MSHKSKTFIYTSVLSSRASCIAAIKVPRGKKMDYEQKECPGCGTIIDEGEAECPSCGESLIDNDDEVL